MEIITIPLEGQLEHRDSVGNHGVIAPGEVQRMSAGTGISHSEFNASRQKPAHLLQIWVIPAVRGLAPSWEQKSFAPKARVGRLLPVASGDEKLIAEGGTLRIHQDTTFYLATLRPEDGLQHDVGKGRRAYLFVIDGELALNGDILRNGDGAKVTNEPQLNFQASKPTELLLIDLP